MLRDRVARSQPRRRWLLAHLLIGVVLLATSAAPAAAQTTGSVLGRVVHSETGEPVPDAVIRVSGRGATSATDETGRFVITGVPIGEWDLEIERLGFRAVVLENIRVRGGRPTAVGTIRLEPAPVDVGAIEVEVRRIPLVEPDITMSRQITGGGQLRELPIEEVAEAVELTVGVTDGHFRGGRIGQEVYTVDGIELKNRLEASSQGLGLEFSPTALEEVEVITGGFGARYGSALSGVVRYATRRGNSERWTGRASILGDAVVPSPLFRGHTSMSASVGGPLPWLGDGTVLFADVLLQGKLDAEPRARGLTCLEPDDAGDIAGEIEALTTSPSTAHLYCPHSTDLLPHQEGDKYIAFLRLDRPLSDNLSLTASVLRNRDQQELYTSEFRYHPDAQLGRRSHSSLGILTLEGSRHSDGWAMRGSIRGTLMRLDRHLGALAPATLHDRSTLAGFGVAPFEFLGEEFVRQPLEVQLAEASPVPGYSRPGGSTGSPFGPAAEGLFFTTGTPDLANWSRSDMAGGDLNAELISATGNTLALGGNARFYRVEHYERVLSHLAGSTPNFARFFPATLSGYAETTLEAADDVLIQIGGRLEAFRSGLEVRDDRANFLTPVVETEWKTSIAPRIGVAGPLPAGDRETAFRFSYGQVVQPPDFRFFLDTSLGDSLRTDIQRQGNPNLSYERGSSWEVGLERMIANDAAVAVTGFRKELSNLVSGSLDFAETGERQFTTGDFGTVQGVEFSLRGGIDPVDFRVGYALQKATGVVSDALEDTVISAEQRREFPLAFDRRHAVDAAVYFGRAGAATTSAWSGSFTASARSGYPLNRTFGAPPSGPGGPGADQQTEAEYLPWTWETSARIGRWFESVPGCDDCAWRVLAEARNLLGRRNVIALRRDTGTIAPPLSTIQGHAAATIAEPIPIESPRYSATIDLNGDGRITPDEYRTARIAAAIDRFDPSLYYGEPRQLRLGLEVAF